MINEDQPRADNPVEAPRASSYYMQGYSVPADTAAWRMSPTYQNAVLREWEGLYGTPNRGSVAAPVPAVCSAISFLCDRVYDGRMNFITELRYA